MKLGKAIDFPQELHGERNGRKVGKGAFTEQAINPYSVRGLL